MSIRNGFRWASAPCLIASALATVAQADARSVDRDERAREQFLCEWLNLHEILPTQRPLDFCADPETEIGLSRIEQDGFWADQLNATKAQFEADWQSSPYVTQQRADQERARAADRRAFEKSIPTLPILELCAAFRDRGSAAARAEILRRKFFSDRDWQLIMSRKIAIGMPHAALICAWGSAKVNRTITGRSEQLQYVYPSGDLVYVEDGKIAAVQDTQ